MNRKKRRMRGGRQGLRTLATIVAGVGLVIGLGGGAILRAQAPQPGPETAMPTPSASAPSQSQGPLQMDRSVPKELVIPSIGVKAPMSSLGKKKGQDLVEPPSSPSTPGWYKESAIPGQLGIATIVGYIRESDSKAGVFSNLARLKTSDSIQIRRKDGSTAIFIVDKIKSYPVGKFDSDEVYGTVKRSELRIITCGGTLHPKDKPENVVVFAHLADTR